LEQLGSGSQSCPLDDMILSLSLSLSLSVSIFPFLPFLYSREQKRRRCGIRPPLVLSFCAPVDGMHN